MRYQDKKWKRKRNTILRRDKYRCRECKRYGKTTEATAVHHIHTVEERPDLYLCDDNLLSLCNPCHNSMHNRLTDELTAKGNAWIERMSKRLNK